MSSVDGSVGASRDAEEGCSDGVTKTGSEILAKKEMRGMERIKSALRLMIVQVGVFCIA